ncbi:Pseudouridine-5'-monophosphatase [Trichinella britovi]|uniref:pseudouridine 5'-phosphatase n=1 Tax=Trichinella britovi TaxID=45882 RepID=A0A0V1D298_TRIBR|nr:Pseudouridine-5'-monophosphatase [Trichinella britovi]
MLRISKCKMLTPTNRYSFCRVLRMRVTFLLAKLRGIIQLPRNTMEKVQSCISFQIKPKSSMMVFKMGKSFLRTLPSVQRRTCCNELDRKKQQFGKVTHVIFDMDGLLLDTETVHEQCIGAIMKKYGKVFDWQLSLRILGASEKDGAEILIDEAQLPLTVEEFIKETAELEVEQFSRCNLMPGAERLLKHLHHCNIPMALCTSEREEYYLLKTKNHQQLFRLLNHRVCVPNNPEIKRGKPYPDCYLACASRFPKPALHPSQVLVFEDSLNGTLSALRAGMQVVMVPDSRMDEDKRRLATYSVQSLDQFKPELFGLPAFPSSSGHKSEMIANKQTETSFVIRQHVDCSKVAVENNRRKRQLTDLPCLDCVVKNKVEMNANAKFPPVTHVIFDSDGLLLDTETVHGECINEVMKRYGKQLTYDMAALIRGRPQKDGFQFLVEEAKLPISAEELIQLTDEKEKGRFPESKLMPGVERLVKHLHKHNIPMAVCTSEKREYYNMKISRYTEIFKLMHHATCIADEKQITRGKPHPDGYLFCATLFDPPLPQANQILVFEDSISGASSGLAAGMQVVLVPDESLDKSKYPKVTCSLKSLLDFKPECFGLPPYDD